jgi:hypothetical protein
MTTYDHAGHEVHAEDVLDAEELGAYYDRRGIQWRPTPDQKRARDARQAEIEESR